MAGMELLELEAAPFAFVGRICALADVGQAVSEGFAALSAAFAKAGAAPSGPPLAHFRPADHDSVFVELGFPVSEAALPALREAGLGAGRTPAGLAVCVEHRGDYAGLKRTYDAMLEHMRAEGLKPAADTWERYAGEGEDMRVEVIWPLSDEAQMFASF